MYTKLAKNLLRVNRRLKLGRIAKCPMARRTLNKINICSDKYYMKIAIAISLLVLTACNEASDTAAVSAAGNPALFKSLALNLPAPNDYVWDWSAGSYDKAFSAPQTMGGEVCDCSMLVSGNETEGSVIASCTWRASSGTDPYCSQLNDTVHYEKHVSQGYWLCFSSGPCRHYL